MDVLTKCYLKDSNLVTRNVAGETIIVPIKNRRGDLHSIFTLNAVGSVIWDLIDGRKSISEIAEAVSQTHEVTVEVAEKDTTEFLSALEEAGLIRVSHE